MIIQIFSGVLSLSLIAIGASRFGLVGAAIGNSGYLYSVFINCLKHEETIYSFQAMDKMVTIPTGMVYNGRSD